LFPICVIVSCAVLLNTTAGFLRGIDPEASLKLDPLSSDTRVEIAVDALQSLTSETAQGIGSLVTTGIRLSPIDARFFSLLGLVEKKSGDDRKAERLFRHALTLLPTEIQALSQILEISVRQGDYGAAAHDLEIIGRRWPQYWPKVEPLLPVVLNDKPAFQAITSGFGNSVFLRRLLIASLVRKKELLTPAYRIVLAWNNGGQDDVGPVINQVTKALLNAGRSSDAYLLFILTRPAGNETVAGYVYNGSFEKPMSGNPFDWQIRSQAGADIKIVERHFRFAKSSKLDLDTDVAADGKALAVRFLGGPLHFKNVSQFTRLTPGAYRIEMDYASVDLKTPEPLQLTISCKNGNTALDALDFESGTSTGRTASADFSVPPEGCDLQRIEIVGANLPLSWRYRYEGTLFLDRIQILRPTG
jgi:hypothetical protein